MTKATKSNGGSRTYGNQRKTKNWLWLLLFFFLSTVRYLSSVGHKYSFIFIFVKKKYLIFLLLKFWISAFDTERTHRHEIKIKNHKEKNQFTNSLSLSQNFCRATHAYGHTRADVAFRLQINGNYTKNQTTRKQRKIPFKSFIFKFLGVSPLMWFFMCPNICWAPQKLYST